MNQNEERTKVNDFEISVLIIRRNACLYEAKQYSELLSRIGEAKRFAESEKESKFAGPLWDSTKINWEQTEGSSGPYERSEDVNNLDFKAMLKDIAAHQGKLTRDGYFYWIFKNGVTVGRKKRQTP